MKNSSKSAATLKPSRTPPSNDNGSAGELNELITVEDPRRLAKMIALGVFTGGLRYLEEVGRLSLPPSVSDANRSPQSDVMTADEVAEYLGVDRNTVYEYAARGVIPHKRLGKRMIFRRGSIITWLDTAVVGGERCARSCKGRFVVKAGREGKAIEMPVRRDDRTKRWFFRTTIKTLDGKTQRLYGTPGVPGPFHDLPATKVGAHEAEQRAIREVFAPRAAPETKQEVLTFTEWFKGRFWKEWVVGRCNKPTEVRSKNIIFDNHLEPRFGHLPLDKITTPEVASFRADLVAIPLSKKRINNILAVLSKPMKYAVDCELIAKGPRIGMFKVERPEIVAWDFDQYVRLLAAARIEGEEWYAAACLAGEAGLRVGEVKALRWREDVDMVARTITVNFQTRNGETTTPKGRTRRTIPMTITLFEALKRMSTIREGFVVRNLDGSAKTDEQADVAMRRICRRAGLPVRLFHTLRHSFGTHAALFGVNPWRLQAWLGHKRIDETMLYVHVAEAHPRDLPDVVCNASSGFADPDRRVLAMFGARGSHVAAHGTTMDENAERSVA